MSRRLDIELTSRRDDGTWTWRAPGAREPRGSLEGSILPSGAAVGDVFRAEADFELEGIFITGVSPTKEKDDRTDREVSGRIEILGSGRDDRTGVSVSLAPGGRRRLELGRERPERGPRPGAQRGERGPRSDRAARPERGAARGAERGAARGGGRDGARGSSGQRRHPRAEQHDEGTVTEDVAGGAVARPQRAHGAQGAQRAPRDREGTDARRVRPTGPREAPKDRRDRRKLEEVTTNRNAALAGLRPEQIPVAEQLLLGGIPAVRRAIDEQNTRARNEGRAEISPEPLMAMAEELLPIMNLAAWKDRALAARTAGRDAPLREVRSVVSAASTVNLDDEARTFLSALRESLEARVTALREAWLARITSALDADRVADALSVSARPPEPGARLPGELAVRMASAASAAMTPELSAERWAELLEAVVQSPVRRNVKPAGFPPEADEELLGAARRAAGFVPELARLLGLPIPPPPGPRRPAAAAGRRS